MTIVIETHIEQVEYCYYVNNSNFNSLGRGWEEQNQCHTKKLLQTIFWSLEVVSVVRDYIPPHLIYDNNIRVYTHKEGKKTFYVILWSRGQEGMPLSTWPHFCLILLQWWNIFISLNWTNLNMSNRKLGPDFRNNVTNNLATGSPISD